MQPIPEKLLRYLSIVRPAVTEILRLEKITEAEVTIDAAFGRVAIRLPGLTVTTLDSHGLSNSEIMQFDRIRLGGLGEGLGVVLDGKPEDFGLEG